LQVADVLLSISVDDFNLREYTSAIDRLVREIDRLGKNERRSTEARIKDYVRFSFGVRSKRTLFSLPSFMLDPLDRPWSWQAGSPDDETRQGRVIDDRRFE
jgi:hypothetical protein